MNNQQDSVERLDHVLGALSDINRLLVREKDPDLLLRGACKVLIKNRGYYNVWAALFDGSGVLTSAAEAGLGGRFASLLEFLKQGQKTRCMRRAFNDQVVIVTENPQTTCTDCPLSAGYAGRGAVSLPLVYGKKVYGILSISIPRELTHDSRETGLLQELAADIAFGLYASELHEKQERVTRALMASEKRFRTLLEDCPIGIFIIQDDQVVYQNPEQEKIFGNLRHAFEPQRFKWVHPDDIEKVRRLFNGIMLKKDRSIRTDFRFFPLGNKDAGHPMKWVYCCASLIDYHGREAMLATAMDVTRLKELEQLVRIQDKMASLGRVAAGIAHEIRNPLSGLNIYLKTLEKLSERGARHEEMKEIFGHIQSASNRIESIVRRVLDFSRPGSPNRLHININDAIEDALSLCSATLRKKDIKVENDLSPDLPGCDADPNLIEEVILNLITNGAEAMDDTAGDKRIGISTFSREDSVFVKITDSGPGVPPPMREKIFDPFYTTKRGNTGIGLSLAHRIILDHGGSLTVSASKWDGAAFTIQLPIHAGADSG